MMGSVFIAFILALGAAVWVYSRFARTTGYGNTKNAFVGAGVTGIAVFVLVLSLFAFVLHV